MNWPRKGWIYSIFCFWSFMQGLGVFFLIIKISLVLSTAFTVAKPSYSDKDEESFRNPSKISCLVVGKERRGHVH